MFQWDRREDDSRITVRATHGRLGGDDTGHSVSSAERLGTFGPADLVKLENPQYASQSIRALLELHSGRLGEEAARISGADWVQIWHVQLLCKPPAPDADDAGAVLVHPPGGSGGGQGSSKVGWHQDRNYHAGQWTDSSEILTAWIALSEVAEADGPMTFVRGSHQWGLLGQGAVDGNDFFGQNLATQKEALERTLPPGAQWEEEMVTLPLGGASFHDDFTIHGSGPNHGSAPRRSLACHMRTGRSALRGVAGGRGALEPMPAELDYPGAGQAVCPVIFGRKAFELQRRAEEAKAAEKRVGKL